MYNLYLARNHPHVSYEYYRKIFVTNFNIGSGYTRSDTCSSCHKYQAEVKALNCKLQEPTLNEENRTKLLEEVRKHGIENELHKRKAQTFYDRKNNLKQNPVKEKIKKQ